MTNAFKKQLLAITLLACNTSSLHLHAGEEMEQVFSLSLEELLNVTVLVASQKPETILETPAAVSRYDMSDMDGMGLHSLIDVLRFIPGVLVEDSFGGSINVQIRGLSDSNNQKVLFLLNDIPYWMPSHADIPLLGIPYESISHIEVIRGPGAVIYGTNASAGVIKVSTKQTNDNSVNLIIGNNQYQNASLRVNHNFSDESYFHFSMDKQNSDGYDADIINATAPTTFLPTANGTVKRAAEFQSAMIEAGYKEWRFIAHTFKSENLNSSTASIVDTGKYVQEGTLFSVSGQWQFDNINYKAYADYNQFSLAIDVDNVLSIVEFPGSSGGFTFLDDANGNDRIRAGVSADFELTENLTFFSGVEFEERSSEEYVFADSVNGAEVSLFSPVPLPAGRETILIFPENRAIERSAFIQLDYTIDDWRALLGARYTNNSLFGIKTTPRAGLVYSMDKKRSFKLLHSSGFSSPNFNQTPSVDGLGNPIQTDLKAEEISTTELSYNFVHNNVLFVANLYHTKAENLIIRNPGDSRPSNDVQSTMRSGLELDYQFKRGNWVFFANTGWLMEGDANAVEDLLGSIYPKFEFSAGTSYRLSDNQMLGTSLESLSARRDSSSINILNLSYSHTFLEQYELSFTVRNLLDDDKLQPDSRGINFHHLQSREPINYHLGFRITF
jgi:outer membrane cobalamin receptor